MRVNLILPFLIAIGLSGCSSYKPFIQVIPRTDVPKGSKEFLVGASMSQLKEVLKANNIMYNTNESGLQTEEFMIDDRTRGQIRAYQFDEGLLVVPYYAYTDKAKAIAQTWGGDSSASMISTTLTRITYSQNEPGGKKVFDYSAQLCQPMGKLTYR